MKYRTRIYFTEEQKALMWDHWQKGGSPKQIAQLFDRKHPAIQRFLAKTCGIRPAQRNRSRFALTLSEREEISRAVVAGYLMRSFVICAMIMLIKVDSKDTRRSLQLTMLITYRRHSINR